MMVRIQALWPLAGLMALPGIGVRAQPSDAPLHLSLLVASDYRLNGLSQTGSDAALRIAADYTHRTGFFAGGFVVNAEYDADRGYASPRDLLINAYIGYQWRASRWSTNVAVAKYIFPDASPSYDYTETSASVSYKRRYYLSYSLSNDYISQRQRTDQLRAGISLPWIHDLEVSLNGGEWRTRGLFDTSYSFWDLGLSRAFQRFALDFRYHDDSYDRASPIGESGDDRWMLSISYAIIPGERSPAPR